MSVAQSLFARGLRLIDPIQHRVYASYKTRLLGGLRGIVVEIGSGTGLNLAYLNRTVTYVGLEPNWHLHPRIRTQMQVQGIAGQAVEVPVESDLLPANSADAVISTLVLCSVPNVKSALASIQRLLRPGGRFVFIEHIAAHETSWSRAVQERITPLWSSCFDGCHPNRATDHAIMYAGFESIEMTHFEVGLPVIRPHCAGYAVA